MRGVAFAAALLAWGLYGCAQAQSAERWRSADRFVELSLPAGWSVIQDAERGAEYPLIVASPAMAARRENCSVLIVVSPPGPLRHDQTMLNNARADLTAEGLFAAPDVVHAFRNEMIDGVRVVSYDIESENARLMERLLQFSRGGRRTEYVLSCEIAASAEQDITAAAQWLASLNIRR